MAAIDEIYKALNPSIRDVTEPPSIAINDENEVLKSLKMDGKETKQDPRVKLINETYADKGISATQDANGQISITNVPSAKGGGVLVSTENPSVPNKEGTPVFNAFTRMGEISKIEQPEDRFNALIALRGDASAHLDTLKAAAITQANNQYDVPNLEQQLEESIAADKADPAYKQFLSDSKHTAQVRAALQSAKGQAEIMGAKLYERNPEASAITDALTVFTNKEGLLYTQAVTREEKKADVEQNIADNVTPGMRNLVLASNPDIAATYDPNDPKAVQALSRQALLLNQDKDFKEAASALASKNETSLTNLVSTDNPYARTAVQQAQTEALSKGDPVNAPAKAKEQTNYLFNVTNSAAAFEAELHQPYNATRAQEIRNEVAKVSIAYTGKDKEAKLREVRSSYAKEFLKEKVTDEFLGNMNANSWGTSFEAILKDPTLSTAYEELRTEASKGNEHPAVSLSGMVAKLRGQPDALKNLQMVTKTAYAATNTGIFGNMDSLQLDNVFHKAISLSIVKFFGLGGDADSVEGARVNLDDIINGRGTTLPAQAPTQSPEIAGRQANLNTIGVRG